MQAVVVPVVPLDDAEDELDGTGLLEAAGPLVELRSVVGL